MIKCKCNCKCLDINICWQREHNHPTITKIHPLFIFTSPFVTNPVHALPFIHHQRSLTHHIDSCTTRTVAHHHKIQFPSSIGTDVTQLITLITLTPENSHTITITQSHTLYKPWTSSCSLPSIVCAYRYPSR